MSSWCVTFVLKYPLLRHIRHKYCEFSFAKRLPLLQCIISEYNADILGVLSLFELDIVAVDSIKAHRLFSNIFDVWLIFWISDCISYFPNSLSCSTHNVLTNQLLSKNGFKHLGTQEEVLWESSITDFIICSPNSKNEISVLSLEFNGNKSGAFVSCPARQAQCRLHLLMN